MEESTSFNPNSVGEEFDHPIQCEMYGKKISYQNQLNRGCMTDVFHCDCMKLWYPTSW